MKLTIIRAPQAKNEATGKRKIESSPDFLVMKQVLATPKIQWPASIHTGVTAAATLYVYVFVCCRMTPIFASRQKSPKTTCT